jgi:protein-disulfide isomerase
VKKSMNEEKQNIDEAGEEERLAVAAREEEIGDLEARLAELKSEARSAASGAEDMKDTLMIPGAVILAGIIISISIVYSRGPAVAPAPAPSPAPVPAAAQPPAGATSLDAMRAISAQDHYRGNLDAPVKIVEYSDTECPFCKQFHGTLKQIINQYGASGKVVWVYRHFPLDGLHPKARKEAEATECANELGGAEGFWKFIDRLYEVTPSNNGLDPAELPKIAAYAGLNVGAFNTCLASGKYAAKVNADYQDAVATGGQGTPHSIMIAPNGEKAPIGGAQPLASVTQMIDVALTLSK